MLIPKDEFEKWKKLKSYGDGRKIISKFPEIKAPLIVRAFQTGKCSDRVYKAISDFYYQKEKDLFGHQKPPLENGGVA